MIGNDIVDLQLAQKESNWQRKGFLDKLFSLSEQSLIWQAEDPEKMVWVLWSCKEAVYKIVHRETHIRAYIPLKINCFDFELNSNFLYGNAIWNEKKYYTRTLLDSQFIDTIAVTNVDDLKKVTFHTQLKNLIKSNGVPYQQDEGGTLSPVSISHHGRFVRMVSL